MLCLKNCKNLNKFKTAGKAFANRYIILHII